MTDVLNSQVCYLKCTWAKFNSDEYTKAIDVINDCYKKMLMIGKSKEVFRLSNDKVPKLLLAKTGKDCRLESLVLKLSPSPPSQILSSRPYSKHSFLFIKHFF